MPCKRPILSENISREISPASETMSQIESQIEKAASAVLRSIRLNGIEANPYQPRKTFDENELKELADSIREHGVLQPIVVRELAPQGVQQIPVYQLAAGERRVRAALIAGLSEIPALVRSLDEVTMLEFAIIENEQRSNVNPIESARSYARLVELGRKQSEIGARIGKSQPLVANALRLLELPDDVQKLIIEGTLSRSHGTTLCRYAKYPKFVSFYAAHIIERKLSSKEIEKGIKLDWSAKNAAENKGLMASCAGTLSENDVAHAAHPDAFFVNERGWFDCLDVALYKRLDAERTARINEEAAARAASVKAAASSGETGGKGGVPLLSSLKYNEYSNLEESYNQCGLCTKECPCRGQAINGASHKVEICLDPERLRTLKSQETREQKKILRVAVAEKSNRVIVESAKIDDRLAVIAVCRAISAVGAKTVSAVVASLKLDFDAKKFFSHDAKTPQRLKMLHELGRDNLLRLAALSVLQCDLSREVDGYADKFADWYLAAPGNDPSNDKDFKFPVL